MRSRFVWAVVLYILTIPGFAQMQRQSSPPQPTHEVNPPGADEDDAHKQIASEQAKKAVKERAAAIKHDTDRLLKLSVELKQSVDKSDENVLSLDVIKKAEEIEKLARSVKEKMKGPN